MQDVRLEVGDRRIKLLAQIASRGDSFTFTPENTGTTLETFQPIEAELRNMEHEGLISLGRYKPESRSGQRLFYRVPATITDLGRRYYEQHKM